MPEPSLPPALDRVRAELVSAAARQQHGINAVRRRRHLTTRPLLLAAAGLLVAGTATAAVVVTTSTSGLDSNSRPDTPAVSNISGVVGALQRAGGGVARAPLSGGTIKGLTVTRDGIHADIATNGNDICFADRTGEAPTGAAACAPLPIPADQVPFAIGHDDARTWFVAIVPDGTTNVTATGTDGQRDIAPITNNVAIAILPGASGDIQQLSWTTPDGKTVTQQPGKASVLTDG
jgi:hypothetical protein